MKKVLDWIISGKIVWRDSDDQKVFKDVLMEWHHGHLNFFRVYIRLRRLYIFMEVCLNRKISILKISYTMRIFYDGSVPKYDVDASCVINFKCLSKSKISQT